MIKPVLAAFVAVAALSASTTAHAALTIVFEALETESGVTGGFTAVLPALPLTYGPIPAEYITECHVDGGGACGTHYLYREIGLARDLVMFGAFPNPLFYFADGALETPGVHQSQHVVVNVGRLTVSGSVDGPPVDWLDTAGVPEPSTWMMMIMGFGLAGSLVRRRSVPAA